MQSTRSGRFAFDQKPRHFLPRLAIDPGVETLAGFLAKLAGLEQLDQFARRIDKAGAWRLKVKVHAETALRGEAAVAGMAVRIRRSEGDTACRSTH